MPRVNFQIVDQQHEWVFGQNGRTGQWVITFQTDAGWQSQVVVADSAYNPRNVALSVAEQALLMDEVGNLSSVELN